MTAATSVDGKPFTAIDPVRTELVMNIVVTCSAPVKMGPAAGSKDGNRDMFWPIVGGYFYGPGIRGRVVPGGADYPVFRPDGLVNVDAFYRLETDDGTSIIIHNTGSGYPPGHPAFGKLRLSPKFTTVAGPYQWLNEETFVATLSIGDTFPKELGHASAPGEDDRLIQIYRLC